MEKMRTTENMRREGAYRVLDYVNPDNSGFWTAVNSEIYVDKSGLLNCTNRVLGTMQRFICNSRPRRFGKSVAADMLAAYYSKGCDSEELFSGLEISQSPDFKKHLNRYAVIQFDVQWSMGVAGGPDKVIAYIENEILDGLNECYPDVLPEGTVSVPEALARIHRALGEEFIVIIDEWDVLIRDEAHNQSVQDEYIEFLRSLFKGTEATKYMKMAYLTGILPIKKVRTQSALNNFEEYTMLDAGMMAPYIGFTEVEVRSLCEKYGRDFEQVKRWYDGYLLDEVHVYNPKAVVSTMLRGKLQSYWSQTGTYVSIMPLINMNFDGLKDAIISMIAGKPVPVNVKLFRNDMVTFHDKDDVLTCLIHLGYLGYDQEEHTAFLPNEEIREEMMMAGEVSKWTELQEFQQESMKLLEATLDMEADVVAAEIEKIHMEYVPVIQYNDENSLSSVLTIGYLGSMQYYFKPIREFPTGRGFADFVFIPKPRYMHVYPALLVELKWNQSAWTAMQQIREKKYPEAIQSYSGELLLVGINYDRKTKEHQCLIEKYEKS